MDEVNLLIESANKRVKASQPDSKGSSKSKPGTKKSMDQFLTENSI